MKKRLILFVLTIFTSACSGNPNPTIQNKITPIVTSLPTGTATNDRSMMPILFVDEFNDTSLDHHKWVSQLAWGHTNPPELQYYSHTTFTFDKDSLRITAAKEETNGQTYSSGVITTHESFQFTYGYVEARMRVPAGKGLWSAFWLLDYSGKADEIDITEILGDQPTVTYMTLHYDGKNGGSENIGESYIGANFSTDYHVFAVDWRADRVIWYVDGVERYQVTEHIPSKPMYLIANLAVGGNWPGNPDQTTHLPAYYDIDYIRVYQNK